MEKGTWRLNPDGTMARLPQLLKFRKKHRLKMCAIEDLIVYRRSREKLIEREQVIKLPTDYGDFDLHMYRSIVDGVHHLALNTDDMKMTVDFYVGVLGMRLAGESENYGTEQEHLNNVFGARLRITSLRAAQGPGVELLEYLAPRTGHAMPADSQSDDAWAWETTVASENADDMESRLHGAKAAFVSPGIVNFESPDMGFRRGFLARDPDGHLVRVTQP